MNRLFAFVLTAAVGVGKAGAAELSATPYRPTVSNPAALPVPHYWEIEAGLADQRLDTLRRTALPVLAKYAFNKNLGVLVGADAWIRERNGTDILRGYGDTSLTIKSRLPVAHGAFGLETGAYFPTARPGLGSSRVIYAVNGIYSFDWHDYTVDLNAGVVRQPPTSDAGRNQQTWAAAFSFPVSARNSVAVELSGGHQRGADTTEQALIAVAYAWTPRIVFDGGASRGLNSATGNTVFAGVTLLLAK